MFKGNWENYDSFGNFLRDNKRLIKKLVSDLDLEFEEVKWPEDDRELDQLVILAAMIFEDDTNMADYGDILTRAAAHENFDRFGEKYLPELDIFLDLFNLEDEGMVKLGKVEKDDYVTLEGYEAYKGSLANRGKA